MEGAIWAAARSGKPKSCSSEPCSTQQPASLIRVITPRAGPGSSSLLSHYVTPFLHLQPISSEANLAAADALIAERVVPRTKKQYEGKIKSVASFYTDEFNRDFTVPLLRVQVVTPDEDDSNQCISHTKNDVTSQIGCSDRDER